MYAGFGKDFDHQVTRDLLSSATLAFEGKDFEQQKAAQRTWKEVARDFWAKQAAESDNEKRRNPKQRFWLVVGFKHKHKTHSHCEFVNPDT